MSFECANAEAALAVKRKASDVKMIGDDTNSVTVILVMCWLSDVVGTLGGSGILKRMKLVKHGVLVVVTVAKVDDDSFAVRIGHNGVKSRWTWRKALRAKRGGGSLCLV